jgi:hypothetical protein
MVTPVILGNVAPPKEQSKKTQFQPTEAKDARRHLPTPHLTHLVAVAAFGRDAFTLPL